MKKLLFILMLGVSFSAFAQLQTNKTAAKLGYNGAADAGNGDKKLTLNFNSTFATLKYGLQSSAIANDGKGLLCIVLANEAPVGKVTPLNNKKADNWGANCNVYKMKDLNMLLDSSVISSSKIYANTQQFWKPANCIVNMPTATADTNQVLAIYPGMYKRVNIGFQVSVDGGGLKSDISFDILTYDKGNTAKTATYKMIVSVNKEIKFGTAPLTNVADMDTIKAANVGVFRTRAASTEIYVVDNVYTTKTDGLMTTQKINVAQAIGVTPGYFNGKKVYVTLYTTGTGSNIEPGIYDPVVAIDNIEATYGPVSWAVPVGAVANAIIDHNNGTPVVDPVTAAPYDYTAGTPVEVPAGTDTAIKIYLTSLNRAAVLDITEANDGGSHNPKYSIAATGAVKAKAADGTYSVDVPYTYTPSDGTTKFDLKLAAPAAGVILNDTIEVSVTANVPANMTSTERLEITNGVRFWYDVSAKGVTPSAVKPNTTGDVTVIGKTRSIVTLNATEDVKITNMVGKTITIASPVMAAKGIAVEQGAYIVKTGKTIQKVIVK